MDGRVVSRTSSVCLLYVRVSVTVVVNVRRSCRGINDYRMELMGGRVLWLCMVQYDVKDLSQRRGQAVYYEVTCPFRDIPPPCPLPLRSFLSDGWWSK